MNAEAMTERVDWLVALQRDVAPVPRPFAVLGASLGLAEDAVLERVRALLTSGLARRFGAVFDGRSLGYASTLCAAEVPAAALDGKVAPLLGHAGITHCYERAGTPNLWFTLTAPAAQLAEELQRVGDHLRPHPVRSLPALRAFKRQAVFSGARRGVAGRNDAECASRGAGEGPTPSFSARERAIVRALQGSLPAVGQPFDAVSQSIGMGTDALLAILRDWQSQGLVRRIGLVLRHTPLGYAANSLCVWQVPAAGIARAGRVAAASPHVSHCYERAALPAFPYNFYVMVHAGAHAEAVAACDAIAADAGLPPGRMLWTLRELKKTSPTFFPEEAQ